MDATSYLFNNGTFSFVRTRSIFSEPSYFGFYLNSLLAVNYFNSAKIKIHRFYSIILSITVLLTVSYSAIAIMAIITLIHMFSSQKEYLRRNRQTIVGAVFFVFVILLVFNEFFTHAFYQRTIDAFTDPTSSGFSRLFGSWKYVTEENLLLGNGLGHTPAIWNIYAYMLSDLGLVGLILYGFFTGCILKQNTFIGIAFIMLNFAKGGYLSSSFWLFVLIVLVYTESEYFKQTLTAKNYKN